VPPLPLPATPLRRSERKREPAPPALVGMITFPGSRFVIENGQRVAVEMFPTTQIDIERLTAYANHRLGIRYRYVATTLESFSWDPVELPLLYITGWTPMPKLPDETLDRLRRYIYDGGTLVVHAQCGRKEFVDTARRELARLFPERKLAPIDTDSPLFRSYFRITEMKVRQDDQPFKSMPPYLEAVYIGCRPAVIFSPIDLNCGWDVVNHPIMGGILYHQDYALAMGTNIVTCTLANLKYARAFATEKIFHGTYEKTRDRLVIGQIRHNGDWDPTPHGLPNLMKYLAASTTLNVQFKRDTVDLTEDKAFDHAVLYMTGLRDFNVQGPDRRLHRSRQGLPARAERPAPAGDRHGAVAVRDLLPVLARQRLGADRLYLQPRLFRRGRPAAGRERPHLRRDALGRPGRLQRPKRFHRALASI